MHPDCIGFYVFQKFFEKFIDFLKKAQKKTGGNFSTAAGRE